MLLYLQPNYKGLADKNVIRERLAYYWLRLSTTDQGDSNTRSRLPAKAAKRQTRK